MSGIKFFLNDIYQGLYYHSINHEPIERAKKSINFRMMVLLFLYYVSCVILLIKLYVQTFGPFKLPVIGAVFLIFGCYLYIYIKLVDPYLIKDQLDKEVGLKEKNNLIRKCLMVFAGSILSLVFSIFIIGYIVSYWIKIFN